MIVFKDIELSDKEWICELLDYSDYRGCEYTFGNNFAWKSIFNTKIARYDDFYLVKSDNGFFFPAGRGDLHAAISQIKQYCKANNVKFDFITMNKASAEWLKEHYGADFEFNNNPDLYDYIYSSESLATLSGKKLHSKRNHINRFKENNWSYEAITKDNILECQKMSLEWCIANDCRGNADMEDEACAVSCGLKHFFELGFIGGLLRVDGKVIAFTYGERVNSDTFVVHVEKAMTDIQGAYTAINNEFVSRECKNYTYINREEDMGHENLRKAKLSYKPIFMEEKFSAVFKGENL